jgi:hypothetical protein
MNNAAHLLSNACAGFKEAVQSLNGPLERDVETSAAQCWDLRERSVQVNYKKLCLHLVGIYLNGFFSSDK